MLRTNTDGIYNNKFLMVYLNITKIIKFSQRLYYKLWEDSNFGYTFILAVDYPKYVQPFHKELPLLPEKIAINKENRLGSTSFYIC